MQEHYQLINGVSQRQHNHIHTNTWKTIHWEQRSKNPHCYIGI